MPGRGRPKMPQLDCTCKILRCSRCHYCPRHSCECNTDDQENNLVVLRTPSPITNNTTITNMISVSTSCTTRSTTTTESRGSSRKRKCKNSGPFPSEYFDDSPVKKKNLADQFSSEKDDTVQNYTEKSSKVSTPEIALSHLQKDSFDDIPTRDIKRLCTRVALDHCHDEYYSTVISSELPRYDLHSLEPTPGQHFRTYGDIVTFHNSTDGSEDKDALDKHKKRVSNADARLSVDFPNKHPREYNFMIKETKKYLQQLCEAQLPNAKDKLFQDVVNQCYEKINAE